jgi:hypothetical protein
VSRSVKKEGPKPARSFGPKEKALKDGMGEGKKIFLEGFLSFLRKF